MRSMLDTGTVLFIRWPPSVYYSFRKRIHGVQTVGSWSSLHVTDQARLLLLLPTRCSVQAAMTSI